jgi:small subunit ribosomal protein S8
MMTDPIADFLTQIRNASSARKDRVRMPRSKLKAKLAGILESEGYIRGFNEIDEGPQGFIEVQLKYDGSGDPVITGIKRVSKPGLRVYVAKDRIPKVLNGLGVAILTTSRGLMTDKDARAQNIGGEVICSVW